MRLRAEILAAAVLLLAGAVEASVLNIDILRFRGDDERTYLELYIDLPRIAVTHAATDSGYFGSVDFTVTVSSGGNEMSRDAWRLNDAATDIGEIGTSQHIVDARIYQVTAGDYDFNVVAVDSIAKRRWAASKVVNVELFKRDSLRISDVELATRIIPDGIVNRFDRGGFGLVPNPARVFGAAQPYFFYYVEVYPPAATSDSGYVIERLIMDGLGRTKRTLPPHRQSAQSEPFADLDSVSLEGLPTGTYALLIKVQHPELGERASKTKFFIEGTDVVAQEVPQAIDTNRIDEELTAIGAFLPRKQRKRLKTMTPAEKASLLDEFWRRYDDDPSTPQVPARMLYRQRMEEADRRWWTSRRPGHMTDRGRVFTLYGEPDTRELHPHEINAKPYELWQYTRIEGGVTFVFVDRSGLGEYELVHSNRRGEIYNPDWYSRFVDRSSPDSQR